MKLVKISTVFLALSALAIGFACHKEPPRPEVTDTTKKRDIITYNMTITPRAENVYPGDTLRVKLNGNLVFYVKGSVTPNYYNSGMAVNGYTLPTVKTGDVLDIYYDPGRVTFGNGTTTYDENGMAIYLDYNGNDNITWKEFNCRCIGHYADTIH